MPGLVQASDEALLSLVASGDELALGELYDRFGSVVYGLALRVVRDPGLAEEAVQDVFLSVWRSAERFDRTCGVCRSWLFTIVHRRAVDLVQRAVRRPEIATQTGWEPTSPSTEETAAVREEQRVVQDALGLIPDVQREALELAYYGGYSQTQIAACLGLPLGTIKTRIFNGMSRLRVLLNDSDQSALAHGREVRLVAGISDHPLHQGVNG
jgi:RNA polymerase sigma factor (sigma-70 family)